MIHVYIDGQVIENSDSDFYYYFWMIKKKI